MMIFCEECLKFAHCERAKRGNIKGCTPKQYFNGKCPYTDDPCEHFKCESCPVEAEERSFMRELSNYG